MITVYHTRDQVHLFVKGWGFVRRFLGLFLRTIKGSNGPGGRTIRVNKSAVMYIESFTDAEWAEVQAKQEEHRKQHEVETKAREAAEAEAKKKEDLAWAEARDKAAAEYIKEHGANPGNWPTYAVPVRPLRTPPRR